MRIIDLCGLPGCGKTTLAEAIESSLGGVVINRKYLIDHDVRIKNYKFRMLTMLVKPWVWRFIILACRAGKECRTSSKRIMRLIVLFERLTYYKRKENDSTVLLEEGIIQYLSALAYEDKLVLTDSVSKLAEYFFKCFDSVVLYCETDVVTSMKRLQIRGRRDLYTMDDKEKQKKLLMIKKESIESILGICPYEIISINMDTNVDDIRRKALNSIL